MWTEDEIKDLKRSLNYIEVLLEKVMEGGFVDSEVELNEARFEAGIASRKNDL